MTDFLSRLEPQWPSTHTIWYHAIALAILGAVKMDRGNTMRQRAIRIDFFGWSIILFDLFFGASLLISVLWIFYPILKNEWSDLAVTTIVLIIALVQGYTVRKAPDHRIRRAMEYSESQKEEEGPFVERRNGNPGRRITDFTVRGLDPEG